MAKFCLKKQSKRVPARRRYKIEKRVRQFNKKKRRVEKKNPKAKKSNKTIIVPNVCPFKEEILKEAEEFKRREKEERQKAFERQNLKKEQEKNLEDNTMDEEEESGTLDSLVQSAQARQKQHDLWENEHPKVNERNAPSRTENSLKAYYKEFRKVVDAADVVLEVVDARDPLGTRCLQVEEAVRESVGNKRLVVVLNKADLVPKEVLTKWLLYLRTRVPAIAFKASTQKQKQNISRRQVGKNWSEKETQVSPCVGAEVLMSLLNNYCRNKGMKTSIHVGIVGLPNVGKSSIINSLKRSRACSVGSMPGVTKTAQVVELDKKIKLLDSPGIVFASSGKQEDNIDASTVLKNAVHVQTIADPITPATAILLRSNKQQMMNLYNLPEYDSPQEFFSLLAETTGKFKKGGIPDAEKAARQLLEDWNRGKIRYFTQPPVVKDDSHVSSAIVTTAAEEFNLDSFKEMEENSLNLLADFRTESVQIEPLVVESSEPVVALGSIEEKMDDDSANDDDLISANVTVVAKKKRKIDRGENKKECAKQIKKEKTVMELEGNQQLNLHKKLSFKKRQKMQARNSKHAASLAGVLENFSLVSEDDKYNFDTDFNT